MSLRERIVWFAAKALSVPINTREVIGTDSGPLTGGSEANRALSC